MRSLLLPFGKAGWKERSALLDDVVLSRPDPPFIYNDVLVLVPSSRLKRLYSRLFLDALERTRRASAAVLPEIQTLHQFLQKHFARLAGPRLIDENSRLVLLEGLVKEYLSGNSLFSQSPDLLAPSLSAALARTIEQLSAARVGPGDLLGKIRGTELPGKPQVMLLYEVYGRYERSLQDAGLTDLSGMRSFLHDHFDPAWLGTYRRVFIDGIQNTDALETAILMKIAACGDCTLIVDAPASDLVHQAREQHPLRIVRDFLSLAGIEAWQKEPLTDGDYLATSLFSEGTFRSIADKAPDPSSFPKRIDLLSAVNSREEVSLIARTVKTSLRNGTPADSILVAFPALDDYGGLIEELFDDYHIPYNRALGRQLSTSPVAAAVVALLRSCQEDFSGPSLVRVFSSPFLKFAEALPAIAPALDKLMRRQRITGGRQKLLTALRYHRPGEDDRDVLTAPLQDLFTALEPFSRPDAAPLAVWMDRLGDLIAWSELGARVDHIKGPLNINVQAYNKLKQTLLSLAHAGTVFPDYRYTFNEWLFLLKKTFMHARFQVPPEDEGGVQVLGIEEALFHPWNEIYLGGLIDGKFPQRLPQNIFLPEQTLESLGIRVLERARLNASYHFYRLLLSAGRVMLTYPENEGDRPVVPSPFLQELTPLKKAGLLNRSIERTSGIQFSLKPEESCSVSELAKAISVTKAVPGGQQEAAATAWLQELPAILPGRSRDILAIERSLDHRLSDRPPSDVPVSKRSFTVTELDTYLHCPYDYYITRILGIEPLEEVSEDLSPLDRGSKVHAILCNFYRSWNGPVTRENRGEALQLLRQLADPAFDHTADTFRNRREKEAFLTIMAERFLDAEIEVWKQGMRPAYLEQKIEGFALVLSSGGEVELSGKIDRIDVDGNGNFMIIDYKTGKYPLPAMNSDQKIFQLPVYAVMARQALSNVKAEDAARLGEPIGLAYYDLAGRTAGAARDVVLFNRDAREDHPSSKPKASSKNGQEFQTILGQSMDRARKAVEGILAGRFPDTPQDENKCRFCPNAMMCEKDDE